MFFSQKKILLTKLSAIVTSKTYDFQINNSSQLKYHLVSDYRRYLILSSVVITSLHYEKSFTDSFNICMRCKKLSAFNSCPASKAILAQVRASCSAL